ncbi:MAG: glycogen synthase [Gemmatimonadota bacterium]
MTAESTIANRAGRPLKIALVTSEALPYHKSGGLADVARSLPDALVGRGHDVRIIHPLYSSIPRAHHRLRRGEPLSVPWVGGDIQVDVCEHERRGTALGVLLAHSAFHVVGSPYEDDDPHVTARRFALFSRAALHYAQRWGADVLHLNDWQTGIVPAYALVDGIAIPTLFAIHNLAYQGLFSRSILDQIGLPGELFRTENGLEFYGNVSFLKGGIALANRISTVSPTYAREIQTPEYGAGFDGLLRFRSRDLFGILNGIDVKTWNPARDRALPQVYDARSLHIKDEVRTSLVTDSGFDLDRPILAVISRLAHQKGIDLVLGALPELLDSGVSLYVLGDGDAVLEAHFGEIARRFPNRIAAVFRFDDGLARRLYAGADFFLMPSRYEPCGLGQMIAQRYGTPPIVRATGGLRDTVRDGVTGFCFEHATVPALVDGVQRALGVWRGADCDALRQRCMALDWSWRGSAERYEQVYAYTLGPTASS